MNLIVFMMLTGKALLDDLSKYEKHIQAQK